MKTAPMYLFLFLVFLITTLFLTVPKVSAAGYTNFQLTNNDRNDTNLVTDGENLAWFSARRGYDEVVFADVLRGRFNVVGTDPVPKKDLAINSNIIAWAQGSGTATNIVLLSTNRLAEHGITTNSQNNRKPNLNDRRTTWLGSDGSNDQIWLFKADDQSTTQITSTASNKNNPRVSYNSASNKTQVYWENENGGISYWEDVSGTPTIHVAHSPSAGCTDRLGNLINRIIVFAEHCTSTDIIRIFDIGADGSLESDDVVTQISSGSQTAGSAPVLGVLSGAKVITWVEGTGTSSEIWMCLDATNSCNNANQRIQITNDSVQDDSPSLTNSTVVYHTTNADGTEDINGSRGGTNFTITSDRQVDTNPLISEIGSSGVFWGGFIRTPSGGNKEIFVIVPQITTPTGSNVVATFGGGSQVTFPTVSVAGNTILITKSLVSQPTAPLTGFQLGDNPTYYDLTTAAIWSGTATVCLDYYGRNFKVTESLLTILHYESGSWVDRTSSLNTATDNICAGVTSFSDIAFAVREPTVISSLSPISSSNAAAKEITIKGSGFLTYPKLKLSPVQTPSNQPQKKEPVILPDIILENVKFFDKNTLTATIPALIAPGTYSLILENRYGSGSTLDSAYIVSVSTIDELKALLQSAGLNENIAKSLLVHLEKADQALKMGKTDQALTALKAFKNELEGLLSSKNKSSWLHKLIKVAYAQTKSNKPDSTTSTPVSTPSSTTAPIIMDSATNNTSTPVTEAKVKELIAYADGLINQLGNKQNLSWSQNISKIAIAAGLAASALLGGIIGRSTGGIWIASELFRFRRKSSKK